MTAEGDLLRRVLSASARARQARLFRNTVGEGWVGRMVRRDRGTVTLTEGMVVLAFARPVTFGLTPGSPDIIGWRSVTITPAMVGQLIAQFTGLELKTATGRVAPNQRNFLDRLGAAGGLAEVVRDPDVAVEVLNAEP